METINISNSNGFKIDLIRPDNYVLRPLPYFNEWVEALESGNYEQGFKKLFKDNRYCCLGVLSKIQGRLIESQDGPASDLDSCLSCHNPCWSELSTLGELPNNVRVNITKAGSNKPLYTYSILACLNDTKKLNFKDIAQIIRHVWKSST